MRLLGTGKLLCSSWLIALLLAGCHGEGETPPSPPYPPASEIDPATVDRFAGDAWVRAFDDGGEPGTELYVFEVEDPTLASAPFRALHVILGAGRSIALEVAIVAPDLTGTGLELSVAERWSFTPEPALLPGARVGAEQETLGPRDLVPIAFQRDGLGLDIAVDGPAETYTDVGALYRHARDDLGFDTAAGAEVLGAIVGLAFVTSQAQIVGFGSSAMVDYLDTPTSFASLRPAGPTPGELTVELTADLSSSTTSLAYASFGTLPSVQVDGALTITADTAGSGLMGGTLSFDLFDPATATSPSTSGSVDFASLTVQDGYPWSGSVTVTTPAGSVLVPAESLLTPDLSAHLPIL